MSGGGVLGVGLGLGSGEVLVLAPEEAPAVRDPVGLGGSVPAGENEDGPADGVEPEHPESATEARMTTAPQPATVSLARGNAR